ncbi:unnamed protein product [Gadus morhua 'NCC']
MASPRPLADNQTPGITQKFTLSIQAIRDTVPSLVEDEDYRGPVQGPPAKKRRAMEEETLQHLAIEVCDNIMSHDKRFYFTKHLISSHNTTESSQIQRWKPHWMPIPC